MVPDLYHNIFSSKILNLKIQEKTANCSRCVMAKKPGKIREDAYFRDMETVYKANLKCCTFQPFFPNFIVGAILVDQKAKNRLGKSLMSKRIVNKEELLPLGLPAPRKYQLEFLKNETRFGQLEKLLCPYLDQEKKQCGFWIYRGSVCASFFCASDSSLGLEFWNEFREYYSLIEITLAEMVLEEMGIYSREIMAGFDLIDLKKMSPRERTSQSAVELKKMNENRFWEKFETPEAFYIQCYHQVQKMTQKQVYRGLGNALIEQEKQVLSLYQKAKVN